MKSINDTEIRWKICEYKYVDLGEASRLFISKMLSKEIFSLFSSKNTLHQKRKIKCGLKVIPFGVTHTIYETCLRNTGTTTEKDAFERETLFTLDVTAFQPHQRYYLSKKIIFFNFVSERNL